MPPLTPEDAITLPTYPGGVVRATVLQGPPGPAGVAGEAGPAGPTGPQGPAGSGGGGVSVGVLVDEPTGVYATDKAAIESAVTEAGAGGLLVFQQGTYVADEIVPLTRQVWQGNGTVIRRPPGAAKRMVYASGLYGFEATGIEFNGYRGTATATTKAAIELTSSTWCRIERCSFIDHPGSAGDAGASNPAIELLGVSHCKVIDNYIANCGYGINLGSQAAAGLSSTGNTIAGNEINGTDWNAIFLSENLGSQLGLEVFGRVIGTIVEGNTVVNAGDCGVESGTGTVGTQIVGNVFVGSAVGNQGILFRDAQDCAAVANTCTGFRKTGGNGITVLKYNLAKSLRIALTGNVCTGNAYNGVYAQDVDGLAVTGGVYDNNTTNGILLDNVTRFAITGGAQVTRNGAHGVSVGRFSVSSASGIIDAAQIENNGQITAGSSGVVVFQSSDVQIGGTRIRDTGSPKTQRSAVRIFDATVRASIEGNDLAAGLTATLEVAAGAADVTRNRNRGVDSGTCTTVDPFATLTAAAFPSANRALFFRVRGSKMQATSLRISVGTSSGNISLGVYANNGETGPNAAPGTRKVTTGAIACPATGAQAVTIAATDVEEGDWVGLSCDNATATFLRFNSGQNDNSQLQAYCRALNTSHPLPVSSAGAFGTNYTASVLAA